MTPAQPAQPLTIKVTLATDPGPAYGLATAPPGWWWVRGFCVAPVGNAQGVPGGSYFSQADLNPDSTVTLHPPAAGWQPNSISLLPTTPTLADKIAIANAAYAAAQAAVPKPAVTSGVLAPPAPGAADVGFFAGAPVSPGT